MLDYQTIPEFPDYAIHDDGRVFNYSTGEYLTKSVAGSYCLYKDGERFHRGASSLLRSTRKDDDEWRDIPGFDKYEMDISGYIRNKKTKARLKPQPRTDSGSWYYQLYRDGVKVVRHEIPLYHLTYPEVRGIN